MKISHVTGVLLAGGKSRRMGTDKRRIMFNDQTLLDLVGCVLGALFSEVLVVVAEQDLECPAGATRVVTDLIPNCATAGGLFTGLFCASNDFVFVAACDMPFLQPRLITHMASKVEGFDITVAKLTHGIQPLHGFYRKSCLPALEQMIQKQDLTVQHLFHHQRLSTQVLDEASLKNIDPQLVSFMNVNSPADLEMARKISSTK